MTIPKPLTDEERVTLVQCPIGLFMCGDELCLKTEYGNNEGRIDAYIVSSGEFFWGDAPQTITSQRAQMVRPVDLDALKSLLEAPTAQPGDYERLMEALGRSIKDQCEQKHSYCVWVLETIRRQHYTEDGREVPVLKTAATQAPTETPAAVTPSELNIISKRQLYDGSYLCVEDQGMFKSAILALLDSRRAKG